MIYKTLNILFVVEKIGPYHNARFNDLSKVKEFKIFVLETNNTSKTYLWEEIKNYNYEICKLKKIQKGSQKFSNIAHQIDEILLQIQPNFIFLTGWYEKVHYYIIYKSFFKKIPLTILSDSRYRDYRRVFYKELIKKILLRNFCSGLVAGRESRDYLLRLNFKEKDIFTPYDVVDNDYFSQPLKKNKISYSDYFLCISRFIKKKNHKNLLKAFEIYKNKNGNLNLLIIGAGPEEFSIKEAINKSKFKNSIFLESWKKTNLLPQYYKKARATVLASLYDQWGLVINESMASGTPCIVSKNCGSYLDLIQEGETGWGFDPNNIIELSNLFFKVENINKKELDKIKNNIKHKINEYSLNEFTQAVQSCIDNALKNKKLSLFSAILAYFMYRLKN